MEAIGGDLRQMQRTPLSASHVQALREAGKIVTYPTGTFLARPGEPVDRFVYVEEGEIEVVNPYTDKRHLPSTLGPTQFIPKWRLAIATSYLSSRLAADPRITIEYGAEVSALHGAEHLKALTIRDVKSGATRLVDTRALFIMVGAAPNTEWLSGLVRLDDKGFVITGSGEDSSPFATSLPGIFAVGDVRAGSVKRVASSVGEGSVVISKVWEFVNRKAER